MEAARQRMLTHNDTRECIHLQEAEEKLIYRSNGPTWVRNISAVVKDDQIHALLGLLHKDYRDLGMTISVYGSLDDVISDRNGTMERYMHKTNLEGVFSGEYGGYHQEGFIFLYPFNHQVRNSKLEDGVRKLFFVFDLMHEVRHAYQRIYFSSRRKKEYVEAGNAGYHSQWVERDANKFAQRFMEKYKEYIDAILGIPFVWRCCWGAFYIEVRIA